MEQFRGQAPRRRPTKRVRYGAAAEPVPRWLVAVGRTIAVGGLTAALAGCSGGHSASAPPASPAKTLDVGCDQVILRPHDPFTGGYRRVLGVVATPPAYIPQVVHFPQGPWTWWEKSGMVIRAGRRPVTVSVPPAWRRRAAITWGNALPPASVIRFAACPTPAGVWNAYAGGFLMTTRGACIPLTFSVDGRRATIRFGIDVRCPS